MCNTSAIVQSAHNNKLTWIERSPLCATMWGARTPMAPPKTCTNSRRRAHLLFFKPTAVTRSLKFFQKSIKISEKGLQLRLRVAPGGTWDSRGGAPSLPCSPPTAACGKIATRCASSGARHHHTTSDLMKLLWDHSLIDIFPGDCMYA